MRAIRAVGAAALIVLASGCGTAPEDFASATQAECADGTKPGCDACRYDGTKTCWTCGGGSYEQRCTPSVSRKDLFVPLIGQQASNWCWAAALQMTIGVIGPENIEQCVQANARLGKNYCCNRPTPAECNVAGWPDFQTFGYLFNWTGSGFSAYQIKDQIWNINKPFIARWDWHNNQGHFVTVYGWDDQTQMVHLNDPEPVATGSQYSMMYVKFHGGPTFDRTQDDVYYNIYR